MVTALQWTLCTIAREFPPQCIVDILYSSNLVVPPLSRVKRPVFFGCLARSGYITNWLPNKKMWWKDFTAYNQSVWIRHQRAPQLIILLVMPYYLTARSHAYAARFDSAFIFEFFVQLRFPYGLVVIIIWLTWCVKPYCIEMYRLRQFSKV